VKGICKKRSTFVERKRKELLKERGEKEGLKHFF